MLSEHSVNIQGTFSEHSRNIQLTTPWPPSPQRMLPMSVGCCSGAFAKLAKRAQKLAFYIYVGCMKEKWQHYWHQLPQIYYTVSVPWMFPICSLNGPWMVPECSLNVHWMFPECSLNVPWMFTECSLNVHWMFPEFCLNVHWIFSDRDPGQRKKFDQTGLLSWQRAHLRITSSGATHNTNRCLQPDRNTLVLQPKYVK
jgi:hypothetical protein